MSDSQKSNIESALPPRVRAWAKKLSSPFYPRRKRTQRLLEIVERVAANEALSDEELSEIAASLWRKGVFSWRERCVAAWAISAGRLTDRQRLQSEAALIELLDGFGYDADAKLKRVVVRGSYSALAGISSFLFGTAALTALRDWFLEKFPELVYHHTLGAFLLALLSSLGVFATAPVVAIITYVKQENRDFQVRIEGVQGLGRIGSTACVPALVRASTHSRLYWDGVQSILPELLPLIDARAPGEPISSALAQLHNLLSMEQYGTTAESLTALEAIIEGIGKLGNAKSLTTLNSLKRSYERSGPIYAKLIEVADDAIVILESRVRAETAASTLLRGANAPVEEAVLLRANLAPPKEEASQLLRPGQ